MATTPTTQATDQQTQATDLKPRPPIKKIITGANPFKPIQKISSLEPPEQTHSKKIIIGANPFKKHHHRSHRSKPIQKNYHRSHHRSYR